MLKQHDYLPKNRGSVSTGKVGSVCSEIKGSVSTGQVGSVWPEFPNYDKWCDQYQYDRSESISEFDEDIARDSINNDPYTDETRWMLKSGLYSKIYNTPELLSDSLMNDFFANLDGSAIADFKLIDEGREELFSIDSVIIDQIDLTKDLIFTYLDSLNDELEFLLTAIDSGYPLGAIQASITGILESISGFTEFGDSIIDVQESNRINIANNVSQVNSAVTVDQQIETNEQVVNDIYLSTIAMGIFEFTTEQKTDLNNIAWQCPFSGGNAVFRARALLALINDNLMFNDRELCNRSGLEYRHFDMTNNKHAKIFPNPANDKISIEFDVNSDSKTVFIISNTMGQDILQHEIKGKLSELSTYSLAPGIYFYNIKESGISVDKGKMVIIH